MRCPACDTPNAPEAEHCKKCGKRLPPRPLPTAAVEQDDEEEIEVARRRRPATASAEARRRQAEEIDDEEEDEQEDESRPGRRGRPGRDGRDGPKLIPYKNLQALISYYCGFFAIIPGLGILLAIAAIILGILGVRYARVNPKAKGTAHAVVGIVLGVLMFIYNPIILYLLWQRYGNPGG